MYLSDTTILTFSVPPQKNKTGVQGSDAVPHLEEQQQVQEKSQLIHIQVLFPPVPSPHSEVSEEIVVYFFHPSW